MGRSEKSKIDFFSYYSELYGPRWPMLLEGLRNPHPLAARYNAFASSQDLHAEFAQSYGFRPDQWDQGLSAYKLSVGQSISLSKLEMDVFNFYVMDSASIIAARNLNLQPGHRGLDMCAAPGGKSLILAEALFLQDSDSELYLNELSSDRRDRLQKVLRSYIPQAQRQKIWIKGLDASIYGVRQPESFDRILLDAPCSSEAHVIESESALKEWSIKRSKGLAQRQFSMVSSAFLALKPGGECVYSTCSIHPQENDEIIERLLHRRKDQVELISEIDSYGISYNKTQYGFEFFPDQSSCGPLFLARFRKR